MRHLVNFRAYDVEIAAWKAEAELLGMDLSSWIRSRLNAKPNETAKPVRKKGARRMVISRVGR